MHCVFSIEIPNVFVEKVEDEQSHKGLKKITEYARLIIIVCAKQAFPSNKTHKKKKKWGKRYDYKVENFLELVSFNAVMGFQIGRQMDERPNRANTIEKCL